LIDCRQTIPTVLFDPSNCDGLSAAAGTTIQACLDTDASYLVNFTSDNPSEVTSGARSRLEPL